MKELIEQTIERVILPTDSKGERRRKIDLINKMVLLKSMRDMDYLISKMEEY